MARPTNLTLCSFCGKSHAEVKKLIAGPGVYICDNCVVLCKQVLDKELATQTRKHKQRVNIPKPAEIKRQLDIPPVKGINPKPKKNESAEVVRHATTKEPLAALIFKELAIARWQTTTLGQSILPTLTAIQKDVPLPH